MQQLENFMGMPLSRNIRRLNYCMKLEPITKETICLMAVFHTVKSFEEKR
jgi:hypothetical protein